MTNKILVTNEGPDGKFLTQYSYPSGILEVEVNIGNTIPVDKKKSQTPEGAQLTQFRLRHTLLR